MTRSSRAAVVLAAALAVAGVTALAAPSSPSLSLKGAAQLAPIIKRALDAADRDDWATAAAQLEEAARDARARAPLAIERAALTLGPHRGLGVYEPLPDDVVVGRALHVMLEVNGVRPVADGARFRHELDVAGRFFVVHGAGVPDEDLGERALGRHAVTSWRAQPLQVVGAEVALGAAPAGAYAVVVTVTDRASGAKASARLPFIVQ